MRIPTPGHNTSEFGLLFRVYYRYDVKISLLQQYGHVESIANSFSLSTIHLRASFPTLGAHFCMFFRVLFHAATSSISEEIVQSMAATQPKKADPRNANWLFVVRISY